MSEPMSEAEKIRNKRLAKLGSSANQAQPKPSPDAQSPALPTAAAAAAGAGAGSSSTAAAPQTSAQAASSSSTTTGDSNPFAQLGVRETPPSAKINITPAGLTVNSRKRSFQNVDDQPLDEWQDKQLRSMFRLSLDPEEQQDRRGNRLHYVGDLRAELEEQGAPLKLGVGLLDQALIEAGSNLPPKVTPLEYFLASWKRVGEAWRKWKSKAQDERREVIEEARRLCMSYSIFAITVPDMFGRPAGGNVLAKHLLIDQDDERGLDHDFLLEISARAPDDEDAAAAIVGAVEQLSKDMRTKSMNDDYKAYVLALRNVVRYPAIVDALVKSELFLPDVMNTE